MKDALKINLTVWNRTMNLKIKFNEECKVFKMFKSVNWLVRY